MKKILVFAFTAVVSLAIGICAYAIDYKSVSVERGDKAVVDKKNAEESGFFRLSTEEKKQWVVVHNHNSHPVKVNFEFKLGHKDAPWKSYMMEMGDYLIMEPNQEEIIWLGEDIKGLRIIYVNVDKSEATKGVLNAIGNVATGLANTIKTEDNN